MRYESMNPKEAKRLLDGPEGWKYVDVRTVEEFQAGHPLNAYNVPVALRDARGGMAPNPDFVAVIQKTFPLDARLVIGCASGVRSTHACNTLDSAGYTALVNMQCGFSGKRDGSGRVVEAGWQNSGLPCEAVAPPERSYANLAASQ